MLGRRSIQVTLRVVAIVFTVSGLWVNLWAQKSIVIPHQSLLGYSLDWLAPGGEATAMPSRIHVYSLSCGECIQELSEISKGLKIAPDRFMLAAFQTRDRAVSVPLIAYGLAEPDKKRRRAGFLELLQLYTAAPDHYLENPGEWETVVAANWPAGARSEQDAIPWAFAANILDMQSRILTLADKLETPNAFEMDRPALAPAVERKSDRYDALVHALAISWIRPALVDRESVAAIGERTRFVNPLSSMNEAQWIELKQWANGGAYWLWGGNLSGDILGSIIDWEAAYLLLRDDATRLKRLDQWLDKTIARVGNGAISPIEAFGMADIDALASPAWNAAQADARQHLIFANYWGSLIARESE